MSAPDSTAQQVMRFVSKRDLVIHPTSNARAFLDRRDAFSFKFCRGWRTGPHVGHHVTALRPEIEQSRCSPFFTAPACSASAVLRAASWRSSPHSRAISALVLPGYFDTQSATFTTFAFRFPESVTRSVASCELDGSDARAAGYLMSRRTFPTLGNGVC